MSRIEEALRRASTGSVSTESSGVRDRFSLATKPRVRIDDFVTERPSVPTQVSEPVATAERPKREPAKPATPIVAPSRLSHVPEAVEGKLVSLTTIDPASVEQYRRLAATLHAMQAQGLKTLMVTSAVPREGKTLTSVNLALTLSESYGRSVLLIDGDLRRPSVHEVFGIPNRIGLSDGIRSAGVTLPLISVTSQLTVLTAGRPDPDPMAGLTSERMHLILKESSERFDWVILDSPPVGLITDASLMAGLVDGVLLVVGAGSTDYQLVERTITELGRERIIGTILNRVDPEIALPSGYYGHYYDDQSEPGSGRS